MNFEGTQTQSIAVSLTITELTNIEKFVVPLCLRIQTAEQNALTHCEVVPQPAQILPGNTHDNDFITKFPHPT